MNPSSRQLKARIDFLEDTVSEILLLMTQHGLTIPVDTMLCHTKGEDEQDPKIRVGSDGKPSITMSSPGGSLPLPSFQDVRQWSDTSGEDPTREEEE